MPVLYTPKQLLYGKVPVVSTIRNLPFLIQDALEAMLTAGEIVSATSFGSLFVPDTPVSCASDIDWLVIFSETRHMLESQHWRVLQGELRRRHVSFSIPVLAMEHVKTGNHTLCSLLHGIRRAKQRIITGEDPLSILAKYGAKQNSIERTLQLFASFSRFFFESYAHSYNLHATYKETVQLLGEMISVWKDVLACMIVCTIGEEETLPVQWGIYEELYKRQVPRDVLAAGVRVAKFLEEVRGRMEEYDKLRHTGGALRPFCEEHAAFLDASLEIIPAAAYFAEVNITAYRTWVMQGGQKRFSFQHVTSLYNG